MHLLDTDTLLNRAEELLEQMPVVPITEASAAVFDRLRQAPRLRKIGRADLLTASIALAHRATLVTRNLRHFRQVPDLSVQNWID
jgi:tRNA(fMet)-specific endonuclease VapC